MQNKSKQKLIIVFLAAIIIFLFYYRQFSTPPKTENKIPPKIEVAITIPEGFGVKDIDRRLTEMGLIMPNEFTVKALTDEGFLFPDTYNVYITNFNPEDLIKKMKDNFIQKLTPELLAEIKKQKRDLKEIIAMASILEKEVKTKEDLPIVAGILWKRIDDSWPLQADATLIYGKETTSITAKELTDDNPYNTYKYRGLPPTPIGNPGIATIRAAIFPQKSKYWFYLTDSEGQVHYAVSNEEQNENRRKFLDSYKEGTETGSDAGCCSSKGFAFFTILNFATGVLFPSISTP